MELQLIHKSAEGRQIAIALLFEEGAPQAALEKLLAPLPIEPGTAHHEAVAFDATALLPAKRTYFRYEGSVTTPPCAEDVTWLVMTAPRELSAKQLDALAQVARFNARPVQPLHGRSVTRSTR